MKKIGKIANKTLHILLIFSIILSCLSLSSCDRKYDEGEVKEALSELLKAVPVLNTVYFGRGIDYVSSSLSDGDYMEANFLHLNTLGFDTISELKALTKEVFTEKYSEELFRTKLEDQGDGEYLIQRARYYQKYDYDGVTLMCIMVDSKMTAIFDDRLTYLPETVKVLGSERRTVKCTVDCVVRDPDGNEQTVTVNVDMIEEKNGWRIDNPIFANYSEN